MTTLHITLSGMTCDQCKARVTAALAEVEGVETVAVDRLAGIGTVVLKEGADPTATLAAMQSAVEAGGRYRIEGAVPEGWCPNPDDKILTLGIEGMTCDKCKAHVTAALAKVLGVGAVEVDREAGTARVVIPPCLLALPEVLRRALHEAVEAGGRYRIVAILGLPVPPAPPGADRILHPAGFGDDLRLVCGGGRGGGTGGGGGETGPGQFRPRDDPDRGGDITGERGGDRRD